MGREGRKEKWKKGKVRGCRGFQKEIRMPLKAQGLGMSHLRLPPKNLSPACPSTSGLWNSRRLQCAWRFEMLIRMLQGTLA